VLVIRLDQQVDVRAWMLSCTMRKSSRRAVVSVASRIAWYTQRRRRLPTAATTRSDTWTGYRA
jgi:hypothetical protein